MKMDNSDAWLRHQLADVEAALVALVPADAPVGLGLAMRYAVLDGGKRLRPLLVLSACEAVHGDTFAAMRAAVAVELIHAYSLVHEKRQREWWSDGKRQADRQATRND